MSIGRIAADLLNIGDVTSWYFSRRILDGGETRHLRRFHPYRISLYCSTTTPCYQQAADWCQMPFTIRL